jgi:predicted unusual protein kinase regulating ubiquinone biosynthesis (AarF/ABC1/UbiB family)
VYRGRAVAVKIRRPGVERIVRADLAAVITLLQVISLFADNYILRGLRVAVFEFRRVIEQEMDFRWEARKRRPASREFALFFPRNCPRCFEELTTERISAFEFHEGARVDDVARLRARGIQPDDLVGLLMESVYPPSCYSTALSTRTRIRAICCSIRKASGDS